MVYRPGVGMVPKRRESHYPHMHKQNLRWKWRHERLTGEMLRLVRPRLSRRVHRARRKAERALALTCVATGGAHTPAPTRAVCEACGISKLRVVRGGGQL